jgi:hypothetical protein
MAMCISHVQGQQSSVCSRCRALGRTSAGQSFCRLSLQSSCSCTAPCAANSTCVPSVCGCPAGRYGYVSFFTKEAADLAISTFDDQLQLQVRRLSLLQTKQHSRASLHCVCNVGRALLHHCNVEM